MIKGLLKDRGGVFELPIQYVIAAIVALIVISLIFVSAQKMYRDYQLKEAIKEVDKIVKEAELMYSTGDDGTKITLEIDIPSGVEKIVFGSSEKILGGNYYIIMKWGEKWDGFAKNVKFTGEDGGQVVIYGNTKEVVLYLFKNGEGEKYVKISPTG